MLPALNAHNLNLNPPNRNHNHNANRNANQNPAPQAPNAAVTNTALPLPHALLSLDALTDITTFALNGAVAENENGNRNVGNAHQQQQAGGAIALPGLFAFTAGTLASAIPNPFRRSTSTRNNTLNHHSYHHHGSPDAPMIDDSFVHRFVSLHSSTLRKFWVVGMRCSEDAVQELRARCEKLERIRADDIDEFPVQSRLSAAVHSTSILILIFCPFLSL